MALPEDEDSLLRSVGTQTATTILIARRRAEEELLRAQEALREETRVLELLNDTGRAIASNLDLQSLVQTVTDAATTLTGARFGAFFYNVTDAKGESFVLFTLSGAPREAFEQFGLPRNTPVFAPTFHGEGIVRSSDITTDPRYGTAAPHHGMPAGHLPVRSYLAVPVRSRSGEVIGGLFFGHPDRDVFTERAERLAVGVAAQAGIAIDNARLYEAAQQAMADRAALLESERAARTAAERMSEMKDEFLATLSHELRTPLNAIVGWVRILKLGTRDEADFQKALETIERNARMQTRLIEDLLDMSRITSGKVRLDVQPLQPIGFVQAAIETVQPSAAAKGIDLQKQLDPVAGPITGDPSRLQQVVWNLLSNAIKFTPNGGTVRVILAREGQDAMVTVEDTGVGIKAEFISHVFERFRQADSSTTRKHAGLGLGLSIVKHLVELHGGSVAISSPGENLGTAVTLRLPLMSARQAAEADSTASRSEAARVALPELNLTGRTILVVDDEPDAADLLERIFTGSGAQVLKAIDAQEALGLIERERPDLLVTDIGMPGIDGFELLRRVRALGHASGGTVPAVALTAFARAEDRVRALDAGFVLHIAKPIEPVEIIRVVGRLLGAA